MFKNELIVSFTKHANHMTFIFLWCKNLEKAEFLSWKSKIINKGNNKIIELRTILQRESQNS
jgi:hypothetical protein